MNQRRRPMAGLVLLVAVLATIVTVSLSDLDARSPVPGLGALVGTSDATSTSPESWTTAAWTTPDGEPWTTDAVIYHVFVDRFADGDARATQVAGTPQDPDYAAALTDWMGGDLAGVQARLDHVVATGANTLWLSPVNPGPFFHGYHPTDLADVGERFGDAEGLRALVAAAQDRGLRVVYDLVLNHTSDQHPWFLDARADCAASAFVDWYRFRACPDSYDAFAGLPELPQLDSDHPPFRDHVAEVVLPFWLDEIGVDGFRLDHVEGPSRDFWRFVRAELDDRWPDTMLLGEIWAQGTIIDSYDAEVDAATAFPFRDRLLATFARGGDVRAVAMPVADGLDDAGLPRDDRPLPATYLSSHDQSRFLHEAGGDTIAVALAYAAILTIPGQPVIYYGDEIGLGQTDALPDGADFADRWFREPMPWDSDGWDEQLWEVVRTLARLRTSSPALTRGAYVPVVDEGQVWAFERVVSGEGDTDGANAAGPPVVADAATDGRLLVVLNLDTTDAEVALPAAPLRVAAGDAAVIALTEGTVTMAPRSAAVIALTADP